MLEINELHEDFCNIDTKEPENRITPTYYGSILKFLVK